jgi:hypothetical protein
MQGTDPTGLMRMYRPEEVARTEMAADGFSDVDQWMMSGGSATLDELLSSKLPEAPLLTQPSQSGASHANTSL